MFVFGLDLPVVEIYLVSSVITVFLLIIVVMLIRRMITFNKKLDELLREEHIVKKELHQTREGMQQTKAEADEQLRLMKVMVEEMSAIDRLAKIGDKEIQYIKRLVDEMNGLSEMKTREKGYIQKMDQLIEKFNRTYQRQIEKLTQINETLKKSKKK